MDMMQIRQEFLLFSFGYCAERQLTKEDWLFAASFPLPHTRPARVNADATMT